MGPQRCDCYGCTEELRSYDELMAGVCEAHIQLMEDDDFYIGVCWQCQRLTYVGSRKDTRGELLIKDKFIMSKGCRHCTTEADNINWMTINNNAQSTSTIDKIINDLTKRGIEELSFYGLSTYSNKGKIR